MTKNDFIQMIFSDFLNIIDIETQLLLIEENPFLIKYINNPDDSLQFHFVNSFVETFSPFQEMFFISICIKTITKSYCFTYCL